MSGSGKQINRLAAGWAVVLLCLPAAAKGAEAQIRLKETAQWKGAAVSLSDVADVTAQTPELTQRLQSLVVLQASEAKAGRELGAFEICRVLATANINPAGMDIYGANYCRLSAAEESAAAKITKLDPGASQNQTVRNDGPTVADELTRTVARLLDLSPDRLAADWRGSDEEILNRPAEPNRYEFIPRAPVVLGKVQFEVRDKKAQAAGDARWRVYGNIQYLCQVVVAAKPLAGGAVIGAEDVKLLSRRVNSFTDMGLTDIKAVLGRQLAHGVAPQTPILPNMLRKVVLIKRKDAVDVCYRTEQVQLRLRGAALSEGGYGDAISVQSAANGAIMRGQVTGPGEVTVGAPGPGEDGHWAAARVPEAQEN